MKKNYGQLELKFDEPKEKKVLSNCLSYKITSALKYKKK